MRSRLRDQWPGWLIAAITATVIACGIVAVIRSRH